MSDPKEMPLLSHLAELRQRLVWSALAVLVTSLVSFTFSEFLFRLLTVPIRNSFAQLDLIGTGPAEAFVIKLEVSLAAGAVLALPVLLYQVWRFVAPGLHESEKKLAGPFIFFSSLFFLAGAFFCYYVVLPVAFRFFSSEFQSIGLTPQIRISEYLSFSLKLILVFGVTFEMPVLTYVLARAGIVTRGMLIRQARFAVLIVFIAAGVLTPPDVISQVLLAAPLLLLYVVCIWVSGWPAQRIAPGAQS